MSQGSPKIEVEDEMERFMQLHGFKNIEEVKKLPVEKLLKMDGFGMRMLNHYYTPQIPSNSSNFSSK